MLYAKAGLVAIAIDLLIHVQTRYPGLIVIPNGAAVSAQSMPSIPFEWAYLTHQKYHSAAYGSSVLWNPGMQELIFSVSGKVKMMLSRIKNSTSSSIGFLGKIRFVIMGYSL